MAAAVGRKKILVVDDSETALMLQRMTLERGYDVITAKDGRAGVDLAIAERPDLILLDVVMPKMNGFEACRALRAEAATRGIPIIMVTSRGEMEQMEQAFLSGCTDYVSKPVRSVELLEKIKQCLGE
jgi:CheY-like chemotaxis protein